MSGKQKDFFIKGPDGRNVTMTKASELILDEEGPKKKKKKRVVKIRARKVRPPAD